MSSLVCKLNFIFCLAICTSCCSASKDRRYTLPVRHGNATKKKSKNPRTVTASKHKARKAIVALLHGLDRLSYDFDAMKAKLLQAFPEASVIALTSVNKHPGQHSPTSRLPITEQALIAYKEIKKILSTLPNGPKQLVLIGHSQGGLRAFALIKKFGSKLQKEEDLTIGRLITIGTPWQGAPISDHLNHPDRVRDKLTAENAILEIIAQGYGGHLIKHILKKDLNMAMAYLYRKFGANKQLCKMLHLEGASDLRPQSDFISNHVALGLKDIDVPITAIAGVSRGFAEVFSLPSAPELTKLDQIYAEIIGGDPLCEHDMLLPVTTQHATGFAKRNFECVKAYGVCHGNKVGMSVKKGIPELSNDGLIEQVIQCVAKTFYNKTLE